MVAIGGKDSMSSSFLDLDVAPTLISFVIVSLLAEEVADAVKSLIRMQVAQHLVIMSLVDTSLRLCILV